MPNSPSMQHANPDAHHRHEPEPAPSPRPSPLFFAPSAPFRGNSSLKWLPGLLTCLSAAALMGCASPSRSHSEATQQSFGKTKEGVEVSLFTLRNTQGTEARISNYGG